MIRTLFKREFKVAFSSLKEILFVLIFFLFCGILFPFVLGPESETLSRYGPGIIWILVLFSISLNLNTFFLQDDMDGSLEQLLLISQSGHLLFFVKSSVQTLILSGLFISAALIFTLTYGFRTDLTLWLVLSLLVALPGFIFVGGMVACLTLSSNISSLLRPLVLFPFYIPLLIFGGGVTESILIHQNPLPLFKVLVGLTLLTIFISTMASGKILENLH